MPLGWARLGWAGLGWAGLGWGGLGWAGLRWAGLGWASAGLQIDGKADHINSSIQDPIKSDFIQIHHPKRFPVSPGPNNASFEDRSHSGSGVIAL